jgi:hypothetical protein
MATSVRMHRDPALASVAGGFVLVSPHCEAVLEVCKSRGRHNTAMRQQAGAALPPAL